MESLTFLLHFEFFPQGHERLRRPRGALCSGWRSEYGTITPAWHFKAAFGVHFGGGSLRDPQLGHKGQGLVLGSGHGDGVPVLVLVLGPP